MSFIDIIFAVLLCIALYKGIKNGLFVELASLIALVVGIFVAIKFSFLVKEILETKVSWEPKYIEITAFALTFLIVVVLIHLSAKLLTKIADFAYLGWLNKLAGAVFSCLKTLLWVRVNAFFSALPLSITAFFIPEKEKNVHNIFERNTL